MRCDIDSNTKTRKCKASAQNCSKMVGSKSGQKLRTWSKMIKKWLKLVEDWSNKVENW
jgi:hypothetical protein